MKLAEFHYDLPTSAIAQEPVEPRDRSKLLVLNRQTQKMEHRHFRDITEFLRSGDVLVLNSTKVFPARLRGRKKTGGKVELLLLNEILSSSPAVSGRGSMDSPPTTAGNDVTRWRVLVRGALKPSEIYFPEGLRAQMTERLTEGEWVVEFSSNHLRDYLDRHGEMPLPPYIKRSAPRSADLDRYQTVYAEKEGAVAAPTAGFHFTPELLEKIRAKGVMIQSIVLHVGWERSAPCAPRRLKSIPFWLRAMRCRSRSRRF